MTVSLLCVFSWLVAGSVSAETFQTWSITVTTSGSQYTGTLHVDSNGQITSSDLWGSTSSGSYEIEVSGYMSGNQISLSQTASYDGGQGYISGSGTGQLNADFPYATYGSGTVDGTISDPLGSRYFSVSFTITKTSGGNGGGSGDGGGGDGFFGSSFPTMPLVVAAAFAILVVGVLFAVQKSNSAKRAQRRQQFQGLDPKGQPVQWREQRPMNPQYGNPEPPNMYENQIPPPISMENGVLITGVGASVAPIELGSLPFLNGAWSPGRAKLDWGTPQFDPSKYALLGYDISQIMYGPTSTAPQNITIGRAPPGANSTVIEPLNQTYQWNTSGDIGGFRVDPVYGQLNENGQIITQFRSGGLSIKLGAPSGVFGT